MPAFLVAMLIVAAADDGNRVGNDPFSRANDILHYSFTGKDDKEWDRLPDDWTRRRGPEFPTYVKAYIDQKYGRNGRGSLRFDINGGAAIYYSPAKRIDALHAYVFEGFIRTQRLRHDAAVISLSFLNHRRQRVQRVLSAPVSGTHDDWVRVRMGPVFPHRDVKFVVVGCHIVNGVRKDLQGHVWFDDLRLARIPQLTLKRDLGTHFKTPGSPIMVTAMIGGLDVGPRYRLRLRMIDHTGKPVASKLEPLLIETNRHTDSDDSTPDKPTTVEWRVSPQPGGFYTVFAALQRDREIIIEKSMNFVVARPIPTMRDGEFGWSITNPSSRTSLKELAEISSNAGINRLKYALWRSVADGEPHNSKRIVEFFNSLSHRRIRVSAILSRPPTAVRKKFPREWSGVREIFLMPKKVWWPTVEPTIAHFSGSVRHWQFGAEDDLGFTTVKDLPNAAAQLKTEFDTIARDIRVGIPWDAATPLPSRRDVSNTFFTFIDADAAESNALEKLLKSTNGSGVPRWISIQPLPRSKHTPHQRAGDLLKRLTIAKANRAEAIYAYRVFDREYGLMNEDGSPADLFLPWRTAVSALRGAQLVGALALGNGSRNFVFERNGEGIIILWNSKPVTEQLSGVARARIVDVWGRESTMKRVPGSEVRTIHVDATPTILRGCSAAILKWIISTQFENKNFESRSGSQTQALLFRNPFLQGVNGKVRLTPPRGWTVQPRSWQIQAAAGEAVRLPMTVKVPPNVSQGAVPVKIEFQLSADRPYTFEVHREFKVVMGDMAIEVVDRKLPDGRLEVQQTIINNTNPEEVLSFRCMLQAPLVRRQRTTVTKLGRGKDRRVYFLPDAESLRGKMLGIRAEQIGGNRVLNLRWKALDIKTRPKPKKKKAKVTPNPKSGSPTDRRRRSLREDS